MKKLKLYVWVFEWFAAAILLAFAITAVIKNEFLIFAFASIFLVFAVFRVVPLVKTTTSKLIKWLTVLEMLIDVGVSFALFFFSEKILETGNLFGYLVGGVIYLRGFMHFFATSLKGEPTTNIGFIANILLVSIGAIVIARGGFNATALAWFFFGVMILCVIVLIWRGVIDYRNFRGNIVGESQTKKLKKAEEKQDETNPTSDEIKINIVPEDDNIDKVREQPEIRD